MVGLHGNSSDHSRRDIEADEGKRAIPTEAQPFGGRLHHRVSRFHGGCLPAQSPERAE